MQRFRHTLFALVLLLVAAGNRSYAAIANTTPQPLMQQPQTDGWRAEYFANPNFQGQPTVTRFEQQSAIYVNHEWMAGSPAAGIPADNFSSRWTRTVRIADEGGLVNLILTGDDELRLLIDGTEQAKIDAPWQEKTVQIYLTGGEHTFVLEHVEHAVNALVRFEMRFVNDHDLNPERQGWTAHYFANPNLEGNPALARFEAEPSLRLQHDWYASSPGSAIPVDNFSSRWLRTITVEEDTTAYISLFGDDKLRVLVDGVERLAIDEVWQEASAAFPITQGVHSLIIEHQEFEVNAIARFNMGFAYEIPPDPPMPGDPPPSVPGPQPPSPPPEPTREGWLAEYWNNTTFSGRPDLERFESDPSIDGVLSANIAHYWFEGSPGDAIRPNNFSSRWTRTIDVPFDTHANIYMTGDDAMRVLMDGTEVVVMATPWADTQVRLFVPQGQRTFTVEHVEFGVNAIAAFNMEFEPTAAPPPPLPPDGNPPDVEFSADSPTARHSDTRTLSYNITGHTNIASAISADLIGPDGSESRDKLFGAPLAENGGKGSITISSQDFCADGPVRFTIGASNQFGETAKSVIVEWEDAGDWFFTSGDQSQPCAAPLQTAAAWQQFERGTMVWVAATNHIYVIGLGTGNQFIIANTFEDGDMVSDPTIVAPDGLFQPERGFGQAWRESAGVRDMLGWATDQEQAFTTTYQWARTHTQVLPPQGVKDPLYAYVEYFVWSPVGGLVQVNGSLAPAGVLDYRTLQTYSWFEYAD